MLNLNDIGTIKKLDPQNTLGSIDLLTQQLKTAWEQVQSLDITLDRNKVKNIVFCGMGASIYGALVLKALQGRNMPYPTEVVSDYHLPNYVSENTLVVLTSYSGTTEEVLSCTNEAQTTGAQMLILTKGGQLATFAKENKLPSYIFDGKLNPSGVPRLGNGYTILGLIGLLNKTGIILVEEAEIANSIVRLDEKLQDLKNQAMRDAQSFVGKIPIVLAAEHLSGNAQIMRNQFNETSKTFSAYYLVPDLNHHLMEGLKFPTEQNLYFIALQSENYADKIQRRMQLTIDVIKQNKRPVFEFSTSGVTIYDDFLETLAYGSYLTLYLGLLYEQNPAVNPWVDYFKEQLAKT